MKGKLLGLRVDLLVCLLLSLIVLAAFWQVFGHGFTNWDDDKYVTQNPHVQDGMTWDGFVWAFTTGHASNWHPLTWLSHMLDWSIFGSGAAGPHAVNLLFHIINTVLLFLVFRRMTGFVWRSAFVAALFGIHPVHVESVAWIAERKDVLSAFFWMLTMLAYVRYTEHPNITRYAPVFVLLALGLMAKPMLVTLPFVLLLLDYWPLRRVSVSRRGGASTPARTDDLSRLSGIGRPLKASPTALVLEKVPLIVLSAASCVVTYLVQQRGGSMAETQSFTLGVRLSNALVAYVAYVGKMFWPAKLTTPYLHPGASLPILGVIASATALVALTAGALYFGRKRTYLTVGWLWFLVTLVPVIGLVQVGFQAMADRYTYIPLIGLFLMLTWGVAEYGSVGVREYGSESKSKGKSKTKIEDQTPAPPYSHTPIRAILAVIVLAALFPVTWRQVGYWKNGRTLFEHTIAVNPRNEVAHNNLGVYLEEHGKLDEAAAHYAEALEINPRYAYGHMNLGNIYSERKEFDKAVECYVAALACNPDYAEAHGNLANAYAVMGRYEDAIGQFNEFLEQSPDQSSAYYGVGKSQMALGRMDEAAESFRRVIELDPKFAEVHYNLGLVLKQLGDADGAMDEYAEAIRLNPKYSEAHNNLANMLLSQKKYDEAIAEYLEAIRISPTNAAAQNNLAGCYYYKGDYAAARDQIVRAGKQGVKLNPQLIAVLSQKIPGLQTP